MDFTVHPHIRGAYSGSKCRTGRPSVHPHIRGAYERFNKQPHTGVRFIPTYVGHTSCCPPTWTLRAVHPHIRGAYPLRSNGLRNFIGSSPHTWGILSVSAFDGQVIRFIPTYVGHTTRIAATSMIRSVHPHIRGAYGAGDRKPLSDVGSSPHTWGIPLTMERCDQ